jgi:hypothetical protein
VCAGKKRDQLPRERLEKDAWPNQSTIASQDQRKFSPGGLLGGAAVVNNQADFWRQACICCKIAYSKVTNSAFPSL